MGKGTVSRARHMAGMFSAIRVLTPPQKTENLGIVAGRELPGRGRCSHYKKSYRWFRFSCCNKVFPCDRCHGESEDHAIEMANRMIWYVLLPFSAPFLQPWGKRKSDHSRTSQLSHGSRTIVVNMRFTPHPLIGRPSDISPAVDPPCP